MSAAAGDAIHEAHQVIEVRVAELRQLFNAIDPSPFHERDLDPKAEEFIVGWSRELPDAVLAPIRRSGIRDTGMVFQILESLATITRVVDAPERRSALVKHALAIDQTIDRSALTPDEEAALARAIAELRAGSSAA